VILDNLSRALKTQNWLAAGVEFVIVIAGVVIGFQINAWAQAQATEKREAALLDRLHDEIEESVRALNAVTQLYETANALRTEAIERLIARNFVDINQEDFAFGINSTGLLPALSVPEGVYTEIVSSGMLSELGDSSFRKALSDYRSEVTFLRGQIGYMRDIVNASEYIQNTPHMHQVYAPDLPRQARFVIDWDSAADDPEFMQLLLSGNTVILAVTGWWEDALLEAEALCAETARLTNQSCTPLENAAP